MKYTKQEIENTVRQLVVDSIGVTPDKITTEKDLTSDLGMDSLDRIELAMTIENHFGIIIPEDRADKINTFGDAVSLAEELVNKEGK